MCVKILRQMNYFNFSISISELRLQPFLIVVTNISNLNFLNATLITNFFLHDFLFSIFDDYGYAIELIKSELKLFQISECETVFKTHKLDYHFGILF